ncbi:MAG: aminopeptidase P family protein [Rhodospirillales bacterium]|nr:aminopeptidase P family protein [Rhodospirillales bacterium]
MIDQVSALRGLATPKEQAFPDGEYRERIAKVRKGLEERNLDALVVTYLPHLCYLTGFQTPIPDIFNGLVLPREGDAVMVLADGDAPLAILHGWAGAIVTHRPRDPEDAPAKVVQALKELGLAEKSIGLETRREGLSPKVYEQLRRQLPRAELSGASDVLTNVRIIKSPLEIAHMRQAARMTDLGMVAAIEATRPGCTDNDIAAAAQEAMIRAGSEYFSAEPFIIVGRRAGLNHAMYKRIPVKKGESMTFEISAAYHRYGGPVERTVVMGPPPDAVKRLADFSLNALNTLLANVRPGRPIAELAREVKKVFKPLEGEIYPRTQFGYSVGIDFPPDWGEEVFLIQEGNPRNLEPGMVFHSPQSIRVPGRLGACISELWTVTQTGVEVFSKLPREMTVVPA